jgi:probable F420-dependent oxidoreductase
MRPFRFGYQATSDDPVEVVRSAQDAESAGFDVFHSFDHVGRFSSALAPLASAAQATIRIRLCPLVLNNDLHHPVPLAQELATIDRLSGGRLEVGMGAGHAFPEYHAMGLRFDSPTVRKERLAESVSILRRLLDGEEVTFHGTHYDVQGASVLRATQQHVPILIGVSGGAALAQAARSADVIGLTMLGRTLADGDHHEVRWQADRLDTTVAWIASQAGHRWPQLELNALIQAVVITPDRRGAAEHLARDTPGLSVDDALTTPFLAIGTHEEISKHLLACRERWNISYFSVRDIDNFAPIIELCRQT